MQKLEKLKVSFYPNEPDHLPKRNTYKIMFSNCDLNKDEDCTKKLKILGGSIINDPIN